MDVGDAVIIIGSIWHGAGTNITSDQRRNIFSVHMVRGCYRSDENQFLAIPQEIIKTYEPEIQATIGYSVSQPYCGWVELDDPIKLLSDDKDNLKSRDLQGIIFEGPGSENYTGPKPVTTSITVPIQG